MARVLLVSNYGWTVFNFRRRLIGALQSAGYEVFVQTEFDGYEARLEVDSAHVLQLDIDRKGVNPLRDLRTLWSLRVAMKRNLIDVCLFFTIKPVVYGGIVASLLRIPYIPNVTGLGTAFSSGGWLELVAKRLYRASFSRAKTVFFQNQEDLKYFVDRGMIRPEKAAHLPGSGVDLARFSEFPYPGNHAPVFLLVARMIFGKGVKEFVDAARSLKKRFQSVRFQLLGPIEVVNPTAIGRTQIEAWVAEGAVEYLGSTDDVVPSIRAADCVVLPSTYREGVPRVLLEAAAVGRPIVTTDTAGCRDAVVDGETGFLCRPGSAVDLADKLEKILQLSPERRAEMGRNGRRKMESAYDENFVISRYLKEVDEALRDSASLV